MDQASISRFKICGPLHISIYQFSAEYLNGNEASYAVGRRFITEVSNSHYVGAWRTSRSYRSVATVYVDVLRRIGCLLTPITELRELIVVIEDRDRTV